MARTYNIEDIENWYTHVGAGEQILLSGVIYTARDAAHKRIISALDNGTMLPFPLAHTAIYYAGPTPAKNGYPIGSCGPTTSCRMDPYMERLTALGLRCTIGKGDRSRLYTGLSVNMAAFIFARLAVPAHSPPVPSSQWILLRMKTLAVSLSND